MKDERKKKSFSFERSINQEKTDIFGLINIDKYLKLDKKPIKFDILMRMLSNYHIS